MKERIQVLRTTEVIVDQIRDVEGPWIGRVITVSDNSYIRARDKFDLPWEFANSGDTGYTSLYGKEAIIISNPVTVLLKGSNISNIVKDYSIKVAKVVVPELDDKIYWILVEGSWGPLYGKF